MPQLVIPLWIIQVLGALAILSYMIAEGVRATFADVLHLFRRPGLMARSILAALVLVPLGALLLISLLDLPRPLKIAIILMSISPAPPLGLRRAKNVANEGGYAVSLQVALCLIAIASVPATLALLSALLPTHAYVPPGAVAQTVLVTQVLPLGVGMAMRRLFPHAADRLFRFLVRLPDLLLLVLGILILVDTGPALVQFEMGWLGVAAVTLLTLFALAVGHWLGGPVLAVVSAARYPGLALVVALRNFPQQRVGLMIISYTIVSALVIVALLRFLAVRRNADRADN